MNFTAKTVSKKQIEQEALTSEFSFIVNRSTDIDIKSYTRIRGLIEGMNEDEIIEVLNKNYDIHLLENGVMFYTDKITGKQQVLTGQMFF